MVSFSCKGTVFEDAKTDFILLKYYGAYTLVDFALYLQTRKNGTMEKKLKWILWLAIVASVSILWMQGYWLKTQYEHEMEQCLRERMDSVAEQADFLLSAYTEEDQLVGYVVHIYLPGEPEAYTTVSAATAKRKRDRYILEGANPVREYTFHLSYPVSEEAISSATGKFISLNRVPLHHSFVERQLRRRMRDSSLRIESSRDTSQLWRPRILRKNFYFHPSFTMLYGWNPLWKQNVCISGSIPVQSVFKSLIWIFLLSLLWTILLLCCIVYQVRTLFVQYRIDRLRKDFSHTMIHELRRPVQTLKTIVALWQDKEMRQDEALCAQSVKDAREELDRLSAYFVKLRDMTYGDEVRIPLKLTVFDLEEDVKELHRSLLLPADRKVDLRLEVVPPGKMRIKADRLHIHSMLYNLLENAVKYAQGDVVIILRLIREAHAVKIQVEDNGAGIAKEDLPYIFEKFYRASEWRKGDCPGLGLGLSYVKSLVKAHKGTISVESRVGEGTTFTLYIPQPSVK